MKSGSSMCLKKGLEDIFTLTAPDGMILDTAYISFNSHMK